MHFHPNQSESATRPAFPFKIQDLTPDPNPIAAEGLQKSNRGIGAAAVGTPLPLSHWPSCRHS